MSERGEGCVLLVFLTALQLKEGYQAHRVEGSAVVVDVFEWTESVLESGRGQWVNAVEFEEDVSGGETCDTQNMSGSEEKKTGNVI